MKVHSERIGCMFGRVERDSGNEAAREEVVDVTQDSEDDESFNPCEKQCHLCRKSWNLRTICGIMLKKSIKNTTMKY